MKECNEGATAILGVTFRDTAGAAVTPSSASYRIDDESGTSILADTAITPLGTTASIEITPAQNAILNTSVSEEIRSVTVTFVYGASRQGVSEFEYRLVNLRFKV